MTATPKAIREILKYRFRESDQPYWLGSNERLIIDIPDTMVSELTADKWILHGRIENTETLNTVRASQVFLDGLELRVVSVSAGKLVDYVTDRIEELIQKLEPDWDEDLVTLMFAAWCDVDSMGVLIDAGLERGAFKPIKTGIGKRADTRTLEEKERDYRADLEKKAKDWSRPYVERLFRDHWSAYPWMPQSHESTSDIRLRRLSELAELFRAGVISASEMARLSYVA